MRYVCTGDLHLGQRPDLSDDRLAEQRDVWEWILDFAAEQEAECVLFAGDAFEGPLATPEQIEAFIGPIENHDVPVLAITGNGRHDSAMRGATALAALRHVPNLVVASIGEVRYGIAMMPWRPARALPSDLRLEDLVVRVAQDFRDQGAKILLTHYSMTGAALPNGLPVEQLHEPVIDYGLLEQQGWDQIVVGHIHKPQELGERGFYVGSPLPLNFGEAGYEHGCWLIDGPHREFFPIPSRPVVVYQGNTDWLAGGAANADVLDFDGAIVRVDYTTTEDKPVDQAAVRKRILDAGAHRVFFKPTIIRETQARAAAMTESLDDEQALRVWLDASMPDLADPLKIVERHRLVMDGLSG